MEPATEPKSRQQKRGGDYRSRTGRLRVREREKAVLDLWVRGATLQQIGDELGLSKSGVSRAYRRGLDRISLPGAREAKIAAVAELDAVRLKLWADFANAKTAEARLPIADRLLRVNESRRKLLGIDAPQAIEVIDSDPYGDYVEQLDRLDIDELRELHRLQSKALGRDIAVETDSRPVALVSGNGDAVVSAQHRGQ